MAHFRGTIKGTGENTASHCGSKESGLKASINGWTTGGDITIIHNPVTKKDVVTVERTGGSNDGVEELIAQWEEDA